MLTSDEIEVINAQRRARSHTLTPGDRQKMLNKRNAKAMARRNTPCPESIAMMCPHVLTLHNTCPPTDTNASSVMETSGPPHAAPSGRTRNYTTETDGKLSSLLGNFIRFTPSTNRTIDESQFVFRPESQSGYALEASRAAFVAARGPLSRHVREAVELRNRVARNDNLHVSTL
jgi:hypothetical protein